MECTSAFNCGYMTSSGVYLTQDNWNYWSGNYSTSPAGPNVGSFDEAGAGASAGITYGMVVASKQGQSQGEAKLDGSWPSPEFVSGFKQGLVISLTAVAAALASPAWATVETWLAAEPLVAEIAEMVTTAGLQLGGVAAGAGVAGAAAEGMGETAILGEHLESAVTRFGSEGFTANQAARLAENPNLEAAFRGERIDTFFKQSVADDQRLNHLEITPRFQFGPDVFNPATNTWWDVTTQGQWGAHVGKYSGQFGAGVPLIYVGF
jgi:hypothetical protein